MKRFVSFLLVSSIALGSVSTTYPADWFRKRAQEAKETVGKAKGALSGRMQQLASSASNKITNNLSQAFNRARQFGVERLVPQLQDNVDTLGQKIGYMSNCMIKGTCSRAERAAFIGTSVTVLALTAAVVGVSLSVATTSKEVDRVTKVTTQEVHGWGPEQIFQRLSNTINNFKQSLASLKQGMLKKELTRGQKQFLYGTALSISALTTLAVGVGIASYLYAEKREAARATVDQPEEEKAEAPQEPTTQEEAPTEKKTLAEKGKGILLKFDTSLGPDAAKTAFQRLFRSEFTLAKEKAQQLNKAIQETVEKGKDKFFESKEAAADFFLNKVGLANLKSELSASSMKEMIQNLLGINMETFFEGIRQVKSHIASLREQTETLLQQSKSIRDLNDQFDKLKDFIENVTKNRIEALKTIKRKHAPDFALAFAHQRLRTPMAKDIRKKIDDALNIYPELVTIVNEKLNLPLLGSIAEKLINASVGGALQIAILTHQASGKLGGVITSQQLVPKLKALKKQVTSLAAHIKQALSHRIFAVEKPSTKKTILAFIKNASKGGISAARNLKANIDPILEQAKIAKPYIEKIQRQLNQYTQKASNIIEDVKQAARNVKRNPLQAIPRFPRIIRDRLENATALTKSSLSQAIKDSTQMLQKLEMDTIAATAFTIFESINNMFKVKVDGEKAELINPAFVEEIRKIINIDYTNINETIKRIDAIISKEPTAAPAA